MLNFRIAIAVFTASLSASAWGTTFTCEPREILDLLYPSKPSDPTPTRTRISENDLRDLWEELSPGPGSRPPVKIKDGHAFIQAPRKRPVISDPSKVKVGKLTWRVKDENGKIREIYGLLVHPGTETPISKYALSMNRKGISVIISDDLTDHLRMTGGFFPLALVDGMGTQKPAIILKRRQIDFNNGLNVMGHEGYHAVTNTNLLLNTGPSNFDGFVKPSTKIQFDKYDPKLKIVDLDGKTRTGVELNERMTFNYGDKLDGQELHAYTNNFITDSFAAHHRETIQAIDDAAFQLGANSRNVRSYYDRVYLHSDSVFSHADIFNKYTVGAKEVAEKYTKYVSSFVDNPKVKLLFDPDSKVLKLQSHLGEYHLYNIPKEFMDEYLQRYRRAVTASEEYRSIRDLESVPEQLKASRLKDAQDAYKVQDQMIRAFAGREMKKRYLQSSRISTGIETTLTKMETYRKRGFLSGTEYMELKDDMGRLGKVNSFTWTPEVSESP